MLSFYSCGYYSSKPDFTKYSYKEDARCAAYLGNVYRFFKSNKMTQFLDSGDIVFFDIND